MPTVQILLRDTPHYRRAAFERGLLRHGYTLTNSNPDVLLTWNLSGATEYHAKAVEAKGGTVLVAENAYIGKTHRGEQWFALAKHAHNGAGQWHVGSGRLAKLGIEPQPWKSGTHILICAQRGIGSQQMKSPPDWHGRTLRALRQMTSRPIKVREHPGIKPCTPIEEELQDAHCCVIWSSGCGVKALLQGVPVIYQAPHWICEGAASNSLADIENPPTPDRSESLERMAWAQWSVSEIEKGEPFACLL